eukprot:6610252-Prymnesium_polylepis.1
MPRGNSGKQAEPPTPKTHEMVASLDDASSARPSGLCRSSAEGSCGAAPNGAGPSGAGPSGAGVSGAGPSGVQPQRRVSLKETQDKRQSASAPALMHEAALVQVQRGSLTSDYNKLSEHASEGATSKPSEDAVAAARCTPRAPPMPAFSNRVGEPPPPPTAPPPRPRLLRLASASLRCLPPLPPPPPPPL